jgi:hypothetical protein
MLLDFTFWADARAMGKERAARLMQGPRSLEPLAGLLERPLLAVVAGLSRPAPLPAEMRK